MTDGNDMLHDVMDALSSLKVAITVAIASVGSGWALVFNVLEGFGALLATYMGIFYIYHQARRVQTANELDRFELETFRKREKERQGCVNERKEHQQPLRREDDETNPIEDKGM